ncbi:MAG: fibronectin type III domain-containing protein, partial [Candidatus Desantisbacteria bacterium]
FTMAHVDPLDTNYKKGKFYTYSVKLPLTGVYSYQFVAYDINNIPAQGIPTSRQKGPVVSNAPAISWLGTAYMGYEYDGLEPHEGKNETQFVFKIRYMDIDGDAPDADSPRLHLFVGGEDITPRKAGYLMKPLNSVDKDYKKGVIYYVSVQLMNNGEYSYEFRGEDSNGVSAGGAASTRMMGPTVSGKNIAPTLYWPVGKDVGVVPAFGEPKQSFVFEVVYKDVNNDAPSEGYPVVKIQKDRKTVEYSMMLVGTRTYAEGMLYRAEIKLDPGIYYHSFAAKDSYGLIATGIPLSMKKGPYVVYAPALSDGENTPALGQVGQTRFTFKVKYMDAGNYVPYPGYPKIHILCGGKDIPNSPFAMSSKDSNKPAIGKQYQYIGTLPYVSDAYTYYFETMNYCNVPSMPTMKCQGPKVLPDTTLPAQIITLQVTDLQIGSITLTWTAPGDDGTSGTAFAYDIRYATVTITETNWANAVQCVNEPATGVAGSQQSFVVTGLVPNTRYYFAMKTRDEVLNWSGLSNVAVGTTALLVVKLDKVRIYYHNDTDRTRTYPFDNDTVTIKTFVFANDGNGTKTYCDTLVNNDGYWYGVGNNGALTLEFDNIQSLPINTLIYQWPTGQQQPSFNWQEIYYYTTVPASNTDFNRNYWTTTATSTVVSNWGTQSSFEIGTRRYVGIVTLGTQSVKSLSGESATRISIRRNNTPVGQNDRSTQYLRWLTAFLQSSASNDTEGIPYEWGGYWFGGKTGNAVGGDGAYEGYGIDCSGLVSCGARFAGYGWNPWRKTTSGLPDVSDEITSAQIQPGDILNNPGDHVVTVYAVDRSDPKIIKVQIIEAAGGGISKVWKPLLPRPLIDYYIKKGYKIRRLR